jgi:predicted dehydrogenase
MADQVRVGVIGTSWWADLIHLPNLHGYPRAVLAAICGRNRERADEMAQKYGISQVFTDYREMIEKGGLDAVVISVPDDLHYPMVMDALDAGLHVLCEKPLAMDAAAARAMYEKAESAGVKHTVFFTLRWLPAQRYLRELLDSGYLGRIYDCQFTFLGGFGRSGEYGWRYDRQYGNGVWADLGSHIIDLAHWYVGEVEGVSAHLTTFLEHTGGHDSAFDPANDSAVGALRFTNGAHGTLHVSTVTHIGAPIVDQQVVLYGEGGVLKARYSFNGLDLSGARSDENEVRPIPVPDHFWGDTPRDRPFEVFRTLPLGGRLFVDAILDGTPVSPTFYDGMKAQAVIDAGIESHETGRWVTVQL